MEIFNQAQGSQPQTSPPPDRPLLAEPKKRVWIWLILGAAVIVVLGLLYVYMNLDFVRVETGLKSGEPPVVEEPAEDLSAIEADLKEFSAEDLDAELEVIELEL